MVLNKITKMLFQWRFKEAKVNFSSIFFILVIFNFLLGINFSSLSSLSCSV